METKNKVFPQERLKQDTSIQNHKSDFRFDESNSSQQSNSSLYISQFLDVRTESNDKEGNMTYFCDKKRVCGESIGVLIGAYIMIIVPTGVFYGVV